MQNYVQDGNAIDWTNDTGSSVASGEAVPVGSLVGVASGDIADTESGTLSIEGVFELPLEAATAIAVGDRVGVDASGEVVASGSAGVGGVDQAGIALEALSAAASQTVNVKLTPGGAPGS